MENTNVTIRQDSSESVEFADLVLSVRKTRPNFSACDVVIGSPGLPNISQEMKTGDALLYETPSIGVVEVRVMSINVAQASFLVSHVSPRPGIAGGFIDDDPNNSPFTAAELAEVTKSIKRIQADLTQLPNVTTEQIDIISRKLDDIQAASQRLGRKDWMNYVAGTITSICVSAAFAPETTKSLFKLINTAFRWFFDNALVLLQ